jgi:CDP-paratose 2-epimerase
MKRRRNLVTGGAGFVGTNLACRLLSAGEEVVVLDDLSRPGVEQNLTWLLALGSSLLSVRVASVEDPAALQAAVAGVDRVFHLAAQVAVTHSLTDPRHDFAVNLGGTLNLLEALRGRPDPPPLLFSSTNKVYGDLGGLPIGDEGGRYEPLDAALRAEGVSEQQPLGFCSPYGCSKGAADQYVLDYGRTFRLPVVVFRMSCIYGPRQQGNEDQGWVAHFLRQALARAGLTIYGDGRQVRDILYVDDLVGAMLLAMDNLDRLSGRAFNVGGGPANAVSLNEILDLLRALGAEVIVEHGPWRLGDQLWYVSDTRSFERETGWRPRVGVEEGLGLLHCWLEDRVQAPVAGAG